MKNNLHPIEALILLALVLLEALAVLAVALVALLLTLTRWKPSAAAPRRRHAAIAPPPPAPLLPAGGDRQEAAPTGVARKPRSAGNAAGNGRRPTARSSSRPIPLTPKLPGLERLSVAELRRLARAANLPRCLSARGRKADLLLALPMAW
jgi:hypothetical protein